MSIKRSRTGKWCATISCEWEPTPLPPSDKQVGIDVGLCTFATLSTGEQIPNPRFFRTEQKALARAQRLLSRMSKEEKERRSVQEQSVGVWWLECTSAQHGGGAISHTSTLVVSWTASD